LAFAGHWISIYLILICYVNILLIGEIIYMLYINNYINLFDLLIDEK
jgi:hypothetical protein